nr:DDB1- and CUL4-associated factor 8 [Limnephilus lunatus]
MEGTSSTDDDNSNRKSTEREKSSSERSPASSSRYPRQAEKRLKRDINEKHDVNAATNTNEPTNITPTEVTSKIDMLVDSQSNESVDVVKDENLDSGISVEKPESPISEYLVPSLSSERYTVPSESEIDVRPSTSGHRRGERTPRPPRERNYRSHRRPRNGSASGSESDNDTQMNSDYDIVEEAITLNISGGEIVSNRPTVEEQQPTRFNENQSLHLEMLYGDSNSNSNNSPTDNSNQQEEGQQENNDNGSIVGTDTDDWSDMESSHNDESNSDSETPHVLLKRKPIHSWNVIKELINRERGSGIGYRKSGKSDVLFEQRFYGSLHTVERLELMYKLNKHKGCVNSINFHPEGKLLVSGSDDLNIMIWDWTTNTALQTIKSGHKTNLFQSKFLHLNAASQLNIVTCARDGQVRLLQVPPSGGTVFKRRLAMHSRPAHKLYVSKAEPHVVISSGEDGLLMLSDVRQEGATKLLKVKYRGASVALYSVAGHPLDTNELCVAGRNRLVRVYDRRKVGQHAQPVRTFCPEYFLRPDNGPNKKLKFKFSSLYVTCAVYNHNGSEILASYNDDDIYLFDTVADNDPQPGSHGFTYRYSGHRNCATFKGVSFFGPHSEFVVSGSDCGNIYIWDKKTEAIVQWMMGDEGGIVNSIECHPRCPVLATCGLDNDIKIWVPSNENEPKLFGLREAVMENTRAQLRSPLTFLPGLYGVWGRDLFSTEHSNRDSDDDHSSNEPTGSDFDGHACRPF